jgi:hypothetical protein
LRKLKWGAGQVTLAVEGLLVWVFIIGSLGRALSYGTLSILFSILWLCAVPVIVVVSNGLLAGERSRRTLDLLLTTPLSGRDIFRQHMAYVRRVLVLFAVPFATLVLYGFVFRNDRWMWGQPGYFGNSSIDFGPFLLCWALSFAIYAPLLAWSSFVISLKAKTHGQAILLSLGLWLGPLLVLGFCNPATRQWWLIVPVMPTFVLAMNFEGLVDYDVLLLNFGYYALLLYIVRSYCLRHADRLLGRLGDVREEQPDPLWSRRFPRGRAVRT